jgi:hypothetical protein
MLGIPHACVINARWNHEPMDRRPFWQNIFSGYTASGTPIISPSEVAHSLRFIHSAVMLYRMWRIVGILRYSIGLTCELICRYETTLSALRVVLWNTWSDAPMHALFFETRSRDLVIARDMFWWLRSIVTKTEA